MSERTYACPKCSSTLFVRVESIIIDPAGAPIRTDEFGMKCSNCLQIFTVSETAIDLYSDVRRPAVAAGGQQLPNRVRSSATAAERGVEGAGVPGRDREYPR